MVEEPVVGSRAARHSRPRFVPVRSGVENGGPSPSHHSLQRAAEAAHPPERQKPKLLDQVRAAMRTRHYSLRTADAYVHWIKRFVLFHGKRHPRDMGAGEISQFLTALAVDGPVSASTQNPALCALLFLYRQVLDLNCGWLANVVRAKQPHRLPVVLTRQEVRTWLSALGGVH